MKGAQTPPLPDNEGALRADKWLWFARFFKSRSLATQICQAGKLRLSGHGVVKPHYKVKVGDVLTFPQGHHIRVIKVISLGTRRGPASEAQALYEDLSPPAPESRLPRGTPDALATAKRDPGTGRPTKRDRRAMEKLRESD
ncbi:RNA-binding S4 domain-containing protein [Pelagibius sp. 7325]|uniref:RNA-binding S4 domain-containing protein n=1 Tax=Pelagibius sp. 7325 TaxID=3131994 RepID=UPI0030EC81E3